MLRTALLTFIFSIYALTSFAHGGSYDSPVGNWVTMSDATNERAAIIQIYEEHGKLAGRIIKIFPGSDRDPAELCIKCSGRLKNKPILGMTFLWGFVERNADEWGRGHVLDPHEGRVYKASMKLVDNGRSLKLHGYWGLFWRTQTWERA